MLALHHHPQPKSCRSPAQTWWLGAQPARIPVHLALQLMRHPHRQSCQHPCGAAPSRARWPAQALALQPRNHSSGSRGRKMPPHGLT